MVSVGSVRTSRRGSRDGSMSVRLYFCNRRTCHCFQGNIAAALRSVKVTDKKGRLRGGGNGCGLGTVARLDGILRAVSPERSSPEPGMALGGYRLGVEGAKRAALKGGATEMVGAHRTAVNPHHSVSGGSCRRWVVPGPFACEQIGHRYSSVSKVTPRQMFWGVRRDVPASSRATF